MSDLFYFLCFIFYFIISPTIFLTELFYRFPVYANTIAENNKEDSSNSSKGSN